MESEKEELERLRSERVAIQNNSRILTCVYCGKTYPPKTPKSNHTSLNAHIVNCPKHPLKEAIDLLKEVQKALETDSYFGERICRDIDNFLLKVLRAENEK